MELELIVKKRKWWQPKWEKAEPTLYVLEKMKDNWFNTFWWDGNCGGSKSPVKFLEPNKIRVNVEECRPMSMLVIIGNTGTDLLLDNKVRIKGHTGNKSGWTCFGYFYGGQFIEKKKRLK